MNDLDRANNYIKTINQSVYSDGYDLLLVDRLRRVLHDPIQIAAVLEVIFTTCHDCWDSDTMCHCSNDE